MGKMAASMVAPGIGNSTCLKVLTPPAIQKSPGHPVRQGELTNVIATKIYVAGAVFMKTRFNSKRTNKNMLSC